VGNNRSRLIIPEIMNEDAMDVLTRWDITDTVNGVSTVFTAEAGMPRSPEAYRAMHRLRAQEFVWLMPKDDQSGMEQDRFDAHSHQFIARLGPEIIGTMRLVPCEKGFPMEDDHEVVLPDGAQWSFPSVHPKTGVPVSRAETLEISRLGGRPYELPSGDHIWTAFLVVDAAVNKFLASKPDRKYVVALLRVRLLDLFKKFGYDWMPLAPPQEFRGEQVQAAWIDSVQVTCPRILPRDKRIK
jgi:N-acyl-L-homoserine lactone synthetase